jgi:hypothetical protein
MKPLCATIHSQANFQPLLTQTFQVLGGDPYPQSSWWDAPASTVAGSWMQLTATMLDGYGNTVGGLAASSFSANVTAGAAGVAPTTTFAITSLVGHCNSTTMCADVRNLCAICSQSRARKCTSATLTLLQHRWIKETARTCWVCAALSGPGTAQCCFCMTACRSTALRMGTEISVLRLIPLLVLTSVGCQATGLGHLWS